MHKSYEEQLGHPADFRVKYRYFTEVEGGRKVLPSQGIRHDFKYVNSEEGFIIRPEFENEEGEVIQDNTISIPERGTARMWILNKAMRSLHQKRINIGVKGFFLEGRPVAECEIIEILGLQTNPNT